MQQPDFQALVDQFYQPLYRFALSLTRNEADACDLTQQTFALWATKGHQLRDGSKVKTWLFTTLYREQLGAWRRQNRHPHEEFTVSHEELTTLQPASIKSMDGDTVMRTLTELDEAYRVPVVLFYMEEYSYKEISEILEIPIGTVMSRISRGKQQLRQKLGVLARTDQSTTIPFPQANRRPSHG